MVAQEGVCDQKDAKGGACLGGEGGKSALTWGQLPEAEPRLLVSGSRGLHRPAARTLILKDGRQKLLRDSTESQRGI